jgi:hypothetical protein
MVYRDVTRQAKGLYRLKHEVALKRGLAYLSRCNSGWFCHNIDPEDETIDAEILNPKAVCMTISILHLW